MIIKEKKANLQKKKKKKKRKVRIMNLKGRIKANLLYLSFHSKLLVTLINLNSTDFLKC